MSLVIITASKNKMDGRVLMIKMVHCRAVIKCILQKKSKYFGINLR